jgi:hypothetical protein
MLSECIGLERIVLKHVQTQVGHCCNILIYIKVEMAEDFL